LLAFKTFFEPTMTSKELEVLLIVSNFSLYTQLVDQ